MESFEGDVFLSTSPLFFSFSFFLSVFLFIPIFLLSFFSHVILSSPPPPLFFPSVFSSFFFFFLNVILFFAGCVYFSLLEHFSRSYRGSVNLERLPTGNK